MPDLAATFGLALLTAQRASRLGIVPRVALLSFSNFGSARFPDSEKVRRAAEICAELDPELMVAKDRAVTLVELEVAPRPMATAKHANRAIWLALRCLCIWRRDDDGDIID